MIILTTKDSPRKLSPHFSSDEFACPCCGYALIDTELATALERVRALVGKPLIINSGYRCPAHNKAIGGARMSRHLIGCAADITFDGVEEFVKEGAVFRRALPSVTGTWSTRIMGIGWGKTFVHVDTDVTRKQVTQWDY